MSRPFLASIVAIVSSALCGASAFAQQQSLFGGAGATGGTAGGAGSAAAGGPAAQGAAFEQGGPAITTELGGLSQNAGQQAFLGRNTEGGFLGASAAGTAQAPTNTPNFRPGGNGGNQNGNRGQSSSSRSVRFVTRINFPVPAPTPRVVSRTVRTRMVSLSARRPQLQGVRVAVDPAGRAVVSGTVPSADAARLALAMVRLEPGIRRVESDLEVAPR